MSVDAVVSNARERKDGGVVVTPNLMGLFGGGDDDEEDAFVQEYEVQDLNICSSHLKIRQFSWHEANANKVWPGTFTLAEYIVENLDIYKQGLLLELGAATGALSIFLSLPQYGCQVVTSDIQDDGQVKENILHNYALNGLPTPMQHIEHTWGETWPEEQIPASSINRIIASDILLYVKAYPALVSTLDMLFNAGAQEFLMSWNRRISSTSIFFQLMQEAGFDSVTHPHCVYSFTRGQGQSQGQSSGGIVDSGKDTAPKPIVAWAARSFAEVVKGANYSGLERPKLTRNLNVQLPSPVQDGLSMDPLVVRAADAPPPVPAPVPAPLPLCHTTAAATCNGTADAATDAIESIVILNNRNLMENKFFYPIELLEANVNRLDEKTLACCQILNAEFCVKYLLDLEIESGSEDSYIFDRNWLSNHQKHITEEQWDKALDVLGPLFHVELREGNPLPPDSVVLLTEYFYAMNAQNVSRALHFLHDHVVVTFPEEERNWCGIIAAKKKFSDMFERMPMFTASFELVSIDERQGNKNESAHASNRGENCEDVVYVVTVACVFNANTDSESKRNMIYHIQGNSRAKLMQGNERDMKIIEIHHL